MSRRFQTGLRVHRNIVSLLSKSTYQKNFPYALREVVSNAYDADATEVRIEIDVDKSYIEIFDNGLGMSPNEFTNYITIAGETRNRKPVTLKYNRPRIGKFGIGFLSLFPFCEKLEITSTSSHSNQIFTAVIPAKEYFKPKRSNTGDEVGQIQVTGLVDETSNSTEHYTRIRLIGLTEPVFKYFLSESSPPSKLSVKSKESLERLTWELQEDLPIAYKDYPSSGIVDNKNLQTIDVFVNGKKLYRNFVESEVIIDQTITSGSISARVVIQTPWETVKPKEMRFLKQRVNNVGIGPRTNFGITDTRQYARVGWVTGEVEFTGDVELTLNRDGFIISDDLLEIQRKIVPLLNKALKEVEDTDSSRKRILTISSSKLSPNSASKKEQILKDFRYLEGKGYKVSYTKSKSKSHVKIDKTKKTIEVNPSKIFEEEFEFEGDIYQIKYKEWDVKSTPPVKFEGKNGILLNSKYKGFSNKKYGSVLKNIFIYSLLISKRSTSVQDYFIQLSMELQNTFND